MSRARRRGRPDPFPGPITATPATGPWRRPRADARTARRRSVRRHAAGPTWTGPAASQLEERRNENAKTIRNAIAQARKRGLLTWTERGVAGGELTAKARALLEEP